MGGGGGGGRRGETGTLPYVWKCRRSAPSSALAKVGGEQEWVSVCFVPTPPYMPHLTL